MKKVMKIVLCCCFLLLSGCKEKYSLYKKTFTGPFDTITTYITYAKSQSDFDEQCEYIKEKLDYYDHLFDKYTFYDNIHNVYTINQNAGKQPVKVDQPLIDLIQLSIERYEKISKKVNIAFGSVINIWHQFREEAESHNGVGSVPTLEELTKANKHSDISKVKVDKVNKTVYIEDNQVSLDVGATAKGYAVELIKQGLIDLGVDNFLLSGGGNVASYGQRKIKKEGQFFLNDCNDYYCVGIESPKDGNYSYKEGDEDSENEAVLVVQGQSIVTSGDYQRFYKDINGVRYHHLIDPDTLYPGITFRSVSVVCEDSGLADFLSSTLFLTNYEEGKKLVESLDGVEAIWLLEDGKIRMSNGLRDNENIYVIEKERLK